MDNTYLHIGGDSKIEFDQHQRAIVLPVQMSVSVVLGYPNIHFYTVKANTDRHAMEELIVQTDIKVVQ